MLDRLELSLLPLFVLIVLTHSSLVLARTYLELSPISDSKSRLIALQIVVLDYLELTLRLDSTHSST